MSKFKSVTSFIKSNKFYLEASKISNIRKISRRDKLSDDCNLVLAILGFRPLNNDIEKELEKLTILECINTLGLLYEDPEKLPFVRLVLKKYSYRIYYQDRYYTCVRSDNLEFHYPCLYMKAYQVIRNLLEMEDNIVLNFFQIENDEA
jgi:hypothetical protein